MSTQAAQEPNATTPTQWKDTITLTIPAQGDKEYKLFLTKESSFEYSWKTNGTKLYYDFHGEPKGDETGFFKSFEKNIQAQSTGVLTTIFEGTHGWYWKNNSNSSVDIILKINGDYQRLDQVKNTKQHDTIF